MSSDITNEAEYLMELFLHRVDGHWEDIPRWVLRKELTTFLTYLLKASLTEKEVCDLLRIEAEELEEIEARIPFFYCLFNEEKIYDWDTLKANLINIKDWQCLVLMSSYYGIDVESQASEGN